MTAGRRIGGRGQKGKEGGDENGESEDEGEVWWESGGKGRGGNWVRRCICEGW